MASDPLLDFAALLAPLDKTDDEGNPRPAGEPVGYGLRQKLDAARKDEEPNPDDPTGAPVARKVDWAGIARTAQEQLTGSSKDFLLGARLTEALTKLHGFAGLRDGLHLLADLVDQCWDRVHPTPDEGESMEVRAGSFHWLSDPDRGARFPNTVREVPLVQVDDRRLSLMDWKRAAANQGEVPLDDFDRALPVHEHVAEDLAQALEELTRLEGVLNARLGEHAPLMIGLREAMEECRGRLGTVVREAPAAEPEAAPAGNDAAPRTAAGPFQAGATRDELYRQVAQIADRLERLEPHSPIPDLLRRAVDLGKMPFRQLVRELIRDAGQLAELRREFGIKDEAAAES
jgi:type VI secretion system protein ImpA